MAADDVPLTDEDVSTSINVLVNDQDADGDPLKVTNVTQGSQGTVVVAGDQTLTYTPESDFNGNDSFTYTIDDGNGGSDTANVSVTVTPVNDPPSVDAGPDASTRSGDETTLNGAATDPDLDDLSLQWLQVSGPTVELSSQDTASPTFVAPGVKKPAKLVFQFTASDGSLSASDTVEVTVRKAKGKGKALAPVSIYSAVAGNSPGSALMGMTVVNPKRAPDDVFFSARDKEGRQLGQVFPDSQLTGLEQTTFLASDLMGISEESAVVTTDAVKGSITGWFMVGDEHLTKLDAMVGELGESMSLYFPVVRKNQDEDTHIFLLNPNDTADLSVRVGLFSEQGELREEALLALESFGSELMSTDALFSCCPVIDSGYLEVTASLPIKGAVFLLGRHSLASLPAQIPDPLEELFAPHFFIGPGSETTQIRLLNLESTGISATVDAYDEQSDWLGSTTLDLQPKELLVADVEEFLQDQPSSLDQQRFVTGFLHIRFHQDGLTRKARVAGIVSFSGVDDRFRSFLPMVGTGKTETVLPQLVESVDHGIFTGLTILNPTDGEAVVRVQVYDSHGTLTRETFIDLPARSRVADLLSGARFFGADFSQVGGHIRVISAQPVIAFTLVGDYEGEFLSTFEGQAISETSTGR